MTSPSEHYIRESKELHEAVLYCARLAAQFKTIYRIEELKGFFDKLRNEQKLKEWGRQLEIQYVRKIDDTPSLWEHDYHDDNKTLEVLWHMFGFGNANPPEPLYPYELSALCFSNWITKLYPGNDTTPEQLLAHKDKLIEGRKKIRSDLGKTTSITFRDPFDSTVEDVSKSLGSYVENFPA